MKPPPLRPAYPPNFTVLPPETDFDPNELRKMAFPTTGGYNLAADQLMGSYVMGIALLALCLMFSMPFLGLLPSWIYIPLWIMGSVVMALKYWARPELQKHQRFWMCLLVPITGAVSVLLLLLSGIPAVSSLVLAGAAIATMANLGSTPFLFYYDWLWVSPYFSLGERAAKPPFRADVSPPIVLGLLALPFGLCFVVGPFVALAAFAVACAAVAGKEGLTLDRLTLLKRVLSRYWFYGTTPPQPGMWMPPGSTSLRVAIALAVMGSLFLYLASIGVMYLNMRTIGGMATSAYRQRTPASGPLLMFFLTGTVVLVPLLTTLPFLAFFKDHLKALEHAEASVRAAQTDPERNVMQNIVDATVTSKAVITLPDGRTVNQSDIIVLGETQP